jgi:hypothetical protein
VNPNSLDYAVDDWPQGQQDGHYTAWNIHWKLPTDAPTGYVIQEIQYRFEGVTECDGSPWDDAAIWEKFGYDGEVRLHYWEAWQYHDPSRIESGGTDKWLIPQNSAFYQTLTEGVLTVYGTAAFYEVTDIDSDTEDNNLSVNFGGQWAQGYLGGAGSPMSGSYFSTVARPDSLPQLEEGQLIRRTKVVSWRPCGFGADRTTKVQTTPAAPSNPQFHR